MTTEQTNEHDKIQQQVEQCLFRLRKAKVLIWNNNDNRKGSITMSKKPSITGLTTIECRDLRKLGWYVTQIFIDETDLHLRIERII